MTSPDSQLSDLCSGNGQPHPPESAVRLQAGVLSVDLIEGELRYLAIGRDEAVRRIYAAVRDGNWNTIPGRRTAPEITAGERDFAVSWSSEHVDGEVDFIWTSRLTGTADGVIRWEFDGTARQAFAKNRIGFCLLHPLATCQAKPCVVEHLGGDTAERVFPDFIAPDQPVRGLHDFRKIKYNVNAEWDVEVEFEGDTFEMEDQRNWTDASFKTYSTPQRIPLPARVRDGQRIRQVITVRLLPCAGVLPSVHAAAGAEEIITVSLAGEATVPFPGIGLGLPSHGGTMSEREVARLRALKLDHVRVDLKPSQSGWREVLENAAAEARRLGTELEIALHATNRASITEAAAAAAELHCPVRHWLLLEEGKAVVSKDLLTLGREVLKPRLGVGTDQDYFQLNNNRPDPALADFSFSALRPQAHAFDDASVIENLDGQTHLVRSALQALAPLPFVASPVTFKRRWHKGPPRPDNELPPMVDRRQLSLLGAGWLTGSLRALTEAGAASVTWFETTGWRGVMEVESGAPLPTEFPSTPGAVFPMYHVLRALADFREGGLRPVTLSHHLKIQAAVLQSGPRQLWIIANITGHPQTVTLPSPGTHRLLDPATATRTAPEPESFLQSPAQPLTASNLTLPPWALAFIDLTPTSN
ncbi:MAG: hypothetical protein JWL81_3356 [Verrucomicrobiales bacterium]|nr:hypothetical protein [Verrucomicrobiales bacterium]